jgi:hypothetical protein
MSKDRLKNNKNEIVNKSFVIIQKKRLSLLPNSTRLITKKIYFQNPLQKFYTPKGPDRLKKRLN